MSIPVNPPIIPPVIPVVDSDATSATTATTATSVSDGELKFKLFYQKPKNDNVLKDLEISQMGLKKCQNYIPIYSKFFSLNDTNYNSINLNQKHSAKTISAAAAHTLSDDNRETPVSKNCGNAIIFPNPKQCKNNGDDENTAFTPVFFKFSPLLDPVKYLAGNYNFKEAASNVDRINGSEGAHLHLLDSLLSLPSIHSTPFTFDTISTTSINVEAKEKYNHYKILDANNSAYVDGFFSYLSSQLLNTHGFIHGIDFYGSYLAIQNEFTINIIDDYEYLMKNDFFKEKNGTLFKFDETIFEDCSDDDDDDDDENCQRNGKKKQTRNRNRNPKLKLNLNEDKNIDIQLDNFDIESCDSSHNINDVVKSENGKKLELTELTELTNSNIFNPENEENNGSCIINNKTLNSSSSSVSCSSRSSNTTTQSNGTNNDANDDELFSDDDNVDVGSKSRNNSSDSNSKSSHSGSVSSDKSGDTESTFETVDDDDDDCYEEEEVLNAVIYNFPVEVIMLERCTKTLDWLMVNDILSDGEWEAALMQIVITLATYQKIFSFTHNDLHTNNVMFIETDKEYIYYFFNKKYYKVPTFGRIFKIIDFGRSIYKFNSKFICSDSFHKSGDAATQYNCEPYFNDKKPYIYPNYSFDLCRLGCSLFDFFIENMEDVVRECKKSRLVSLVVDWVTDDDGRNILYKKDGVDRYPDFKLYKMIARTVHNKVPSQQLKHCVFTQYEVTQKSIKNVSKAEIINIDKYPVYT